MVDSHEKHKTVASVFKGGFCDTFLDVTCGHGVYTPWLCGWLQLPCDGLEDLPECFPVSHLETTGQAQAPPCDPCWK